MTCAGFCAGFWAGFLAFLPYVVGVVGGYALCLLVSALYRAFASIARNG